MTTPRQNIIMNIANNLYAEFERNIDSSFSHIDKLRELCDDENEEVALVKHYELISRIQLEFLEILTKQYNENLEKISQMEDDLFKN